MDRTMKTISFTIVHYGSDYLGWAIKSVYDQVDECHVVYTDKPSHGHGQVMKNPDSKQAIRESLFRFGDPQNKIKWTEGRWGNEGAHRMTANDLAQKAEADIVVVVDADEIWQAEGLRRSIEFARANEQRAYKAHMIHFWRSFGYVCRDQMMPDRIINRKGKPGTHNYLPNQKSPILHFGYARELKHIQYKISIHGHKNEWRPKWWERYQNWHPGMDDMHPCCLNIWNPRPFDREELPKLLKDHPYYDLPIIT